jgi:hypothetical protein
MYVDAVEQLLVVQSQEIGDICFLVGNKNEIKIEMI